jgi:hypothetical protein
MSQKVGALALIVIAMAIIYFGQQLLSEGKQRLGA